MRIENWLISDFSHRIRFFFCHCLIIVGVLWVWKPKENCWKTKRGFSIHRTPYSLFICHKKGNILWFPTFLLIHIHLPFLWEKCFPILVYMRGLWERGFFPCGSVECTNRKNWKKYELIQKRKRKCSYLKRETVHT